jgi:TIR domain
MNDIHTKRDFFISFNKVDRAWASWIAWVLEADGYKVWFQDWDFRGNFIEHMQRAHREAHRTLAVLSDHYFGSQFTIAEWTTRLAEDPAARADLLVPVKVGPLSDAGQRLAPVVFPVRDTERVR